MQNAMKKAFRKVFDFLVVFFSRNASRRVLKSALGRLLGASWAPLGSFLGDFWGLLGASWGFLECQKRRKASQRAPKGLQKRPKGLPKVSQRPPKGIPKASRRSPEGLPKAPQGIKKTLANSFGLWRFSGKLVATSS